MAAKLKVLDLFSGIGGFSLGLERTGGFETVAFCEIDPFCQKILAKHWPNVKCYNDVRTLDYDGAVDVITGGYPCQPFSTAGRRKGQDDDRHLWPAMFSLIQKYRPTWVIGENVAGHFSMGLDDVLFDLEGAGYGARAFIIPAIAVDAKHRRDRIWIVANAKSARKRGEVRDFHQENGGQERGLFQQLNGSSEGLAHTQGNDTRRCAGGTQEKQPRPSCNGEYVADPASIGQSGPGQFVQRSNKAPAREGKANQPLSVCKPYVWPIEPPVGRVAHGISNRMDRLKALGNSVVPQIPEIIGNAILATY